MYNKEKNKFYTIIDAGGNRGFTSLSYAII